jgi:hypothetical protein
MKLFSLLLALTLLPSLVFADDRAVFPTPESARSALIGALRAHDRSAMLRLLGSNAADLVDSGDPTYDAFLAGKITDAAAKNCTISLRDSKTVFFNVGPNQWRLPIPLVKVDEGWVFDTDRGRQQILQNRARRAEAATVNAFREYVKAQLKYAQQDRNGDGVREYAQQFLSSEGKRDGLYYPVQGPGEVSPLWPLVAKAQDQGYFANLTRGRTPFKGYYYKILTSQGASAPGGARNYLSGGHLTGGFALIAWPAKYGDSGVNTFIVNQSGRILKKDLGPDTAKLAPKITSYNPDAGWAPAAY